MYSITDVFLPPVLPERQMANSMTSSSSLSPSLSGISKELVEMRHLVQFPEEIACILTEQEQQLYQRVGAHAGRPKSQHWTLAPSLIWTRSALFPCAGLPTGLPVFSHSRPGQPRRSEQAAP